MDTKPVVEALGAIPVGTVVAWAVVIGGIIAAIVAGIVKLYKTFERYKEFKEKDERRQAALEKHEEVLGDIQSSLKRIENNFATDHEVNKRRLKHEITDYCNRAINEKKVRLSTLRSIEEMFDDYVEVFDGNSWVHTLVEKVRLLPIERDIEE